MSFPSPGSPRSEFFSEEGGRPGERRGFIHKRILRTISTVSRIVPIPGAGIIGGVAAALAGPRTTGAGQPRAAPRLLASVPGLATTTASCAPGLVLNPITGQCEAAPAVPVPGIRGAIQRFLPGGETGFEAPAPGVVGDFGEAVMGRYGAGLVPARRVTETAVCPRGAVLGNDGICYNRTSIRNGDRMWPRGRRPLLTGGEMRAISIATRAAGKVKRNNKRLIELGLLRPATVRKAAAPKRAAKTVLIESGPGSVVA